MVNSYGTPRYFIFGSFLTYLIDLFWFYLIKDTLFPFRKFPFISAWIVSRSGYLTFSESVGWGLRSYNRSNFVFLYVFSRRAHGRSWLVPFWSVSGLTRIKKYFLRVPVISQGNRPILRDVGTWGSVRISTEVFGSSVKLIRYTKSLI